MAHAMLDSRDDCPTASSMGFGATTTTTRSLGVSGVEADDDEVELVSETQKTEKDPTKITKKKGTTIQTLDNPLIPFLKMGENKF
uniref:Uncharacterized protein n=1 Tax=Quercus lobata TaxID=97700 RepID=A0A7N2LGR9_QUELO